MSAAAATTMQAERAGLPFCSLPRVPVSRDADAIEAAEGLGAPKLPASTLATSIRVLLDAQAAADEARAEHLAAGQKWARAMATVQLAQQACAMDMPNGAEPVTVRVSVTHVATVTKAGQGVTVVKSRVLAGRAA